MRSIDGLQIFPGAVDRYLRAEGRSNMRDYVDIAIVTQSVGLHPADRLLHEILRERIFAEEQFIRALRVFNPRPGMIAREKAQRRFERVAVEFVVVFERL